MPATISMNGSLYQYMSKRGLYFAFQVYNHPVAVFRVLHYTQNQAHWVQFRQHSCCGVSTVSRFSTVLSSQSLASVLVSSNAQVRPLLSSLKR